MVYGELYTKFKGSHRLARPRWGRSALLKELGYPASNGLEGYARAGFHETRFPSKKKRGLAESTHRKGG